MTCPSGGSQTSTGVQKEITFAADRRRRRVVVVSAPETKPSQTRSLSDLRRVHPTDSTLQNLLTLLKAELDLCARLPVFEYEAATEGHDECAGVLRRVADAERAN